MANVNEPGPLVSTGHSRAAGVGLLMATAVLWSLAGVAVKVVTMPPLGFTVFRSLAGGLCMAALWLFVRKGRLHRGWMLASIVLYTGTVGFLITAMTRSTAATGILLQYTGPIWCALLAWYFQRRRIGARRIAAIVVAAAGIVIMIVGREAGADLLGIICGALSGIAFGSLIIVLEKLDRASSGDVHPVQIVMWNNLGAALLLLPVAALTGSLHAESWQLSVVGATGVIQLALPYLLFQVALRRVHPVDASLLILLEPVLNPLWVAWATGERPGMGTIVGGVVILAALVIELTAKREPAVDKAVPNG